MVDRKLQYQPLNFFTNTFEAIKSWELHLVVIVLTLVECIQ